MSRKDNSVLGEALPSPLPDPGPNEIPVVQRLRQKLVRTGPRGLTNAELLAVVLGGPSRGQDALKIAEGVIQNVGVTDLPGLPVSAWRKNAGVGAATACRLTTAFELGRRILLPQEAPRVGSPAEAYALVRDLRTARKEHLVALYLDAQNGLICRETVSIGGLNTTRTHPREVLQPAIVNSALAFILVHNHPSGSLDPSRDDVEFTRTMQKAGELIGISLYDHLIVSSKGFVSLKEKGLL